MSENQTNQQKTSEKTLTIEADLPGGVAPGRQVDDFCKACGGQCCKHFSIIARPGELMRGLLGVHYGCEVKEIKFEIRHTCPHLRDDGLCELWNEDPEKDNRPDFCKNFLCDRAKRKMIVIQAGGDE